MPADSNRSKYLFEKYLQNNISAKELNEFWEQMEGLEQDDPVTEAILSVWGQKNHTRYREDQMKWDSLYNSILSRADAVEKRQETRSASGRFIRWQWWAAASVVIFFIAGVWFYQNWEKADVGYNVAEVASQIKAPETNRATITLSDGSSVYLDNLNNGEVAQQGNIKVIKLDNGQIAYETALGEISKELQYNTLSNPRGSKVIDMKLSDGSRVWLNAGSSITYPVAFLGDERKVELKGEGYFEVANNKEMPFFVKNGNVEVQVLGTHFNVFAYGDEAAIKISLLEGLVKVFNKQTSKDLKPGQQATLNETSEIQVQNVDVESAVAWKNGYFNFEGKKLDEVLRQISRWYDIDVAYEEGVPDIEFGGKIQRELPLNEVMKILQASQVKFKMENGKLKLIK